MYSSSHEFWGQWKANEGLHIAYNNAGLNSKGSEDVAPKILKIAVFYHHTIV